MPQTMAEQRRSSWPWRKRSSLHHPKGQDRAAAFLSSATASIPSPVSSFKEEDVSSFMLATKDTIEKDEAPEEQQFLVTDGSRLVEETRLRQQAEENLKSAKEELNAMRREISAKEASLSQHQRAVAEAISEKENAKKEVLLYKAELEATSQQKSILEDRVAQLDGALRECTRQVKQAREEQQKKIEEAILGKAREWERIKAEVEARQAELEQKLMESEAEKSAMAKSLQERARKMMEANEGKAMAETEAKLLQVKLSSSEKEIASLKYELHVASKEVDIRNEEVEFMKKSADAAHRQHLENVKKMANLEADCQRLRNLVRKKLPGPAAIAQMRKELDISPPSSDFPKRRASASPKSVANNNNGSRTADIQMLRDRMLAMESETKLLKDALSKRNNDDPLLSLSPPSTHGRAPFSADDNSTSVDGGDPDRRRDRLALDQTSCSDSWASALISELALFKKDKDKSCPPSPELPSPSAPHLPRSPVQDLPSSPQPDPSSTLLHLCKDLDGRLCAIQEHLQTMMSSVEKDGVCPIEKRIVNLIDGGHERFLEIEKFIRGAGAVTKGSVSEVDLWGKDVPVPLSSLDSVLSKIISLLELLPGEARSVGDSKHDAAEGEKQSTSGGDDPNSVVVDVEAASSQSSPVKEALISSKDRFLQGKSSIFEYLLRLAVVLCQICDSESSDIEDMLSRLSAASDDCPTPTQVNAAGFLSELSVLREELRQAEESKSKLEQHMATSAQELEATKSDLDKSNQLLVTMKEQLAELEGMKERLSEEEALKAEVQKRLEASEAEVCKLEACVAALKLELEDRKAVHDGSAATKGGGGDLERKAEEGSLVIEEDDETQSGGCDFAERHSMSSRKERELVEAKTKLVECQRTIVALGRQLTALSLPSVAVDQSSSVSSFDGASSMDSAPQQADRRMQMELQTAMTEELQQQGHHHPSHQHQQHVNGNVGSKHGARGVAMQNHHFLQHQQKWGAGNAQNGGRLYQEEVLLQRGWNSSNHSNSNNGLANGGSNGTNNGGAMVVGAYGHAGDGYTSGKYGHGAGNRQQEQQQQRRGIVQGSYNTNVDDEGQPLQYDVGPINNGVCRNGYHQNLEDALLLETDQDLHGLHHHRHHQQQQQLMNCYSGHLLPYNNNNNSSPPLMSPARSPGRYIQQMGTRASHRTGVCVSLADSMNAVAGSNRDSVALPGTPTSASKSSGLGRLFSRSKNRT